MTKKPATPSQKKPKSTRSVATSPPPPPKPPSVRKKTKAPEAKQDKTLPPVLKRLLEDPDAIRNLRHYLPSWTDELIAVILIVGGGVAFASLLNAGSGEGEIASQLFTTLRQGFGNGSYMVALAILLGGFIILLPKIGVQVSFSWGRLVALELTFLCFQGFLHIIEFETESRALAREGGGGGYIGWAVSSVLVQIFDNHKANLIAKNLN